MKMIPRIRGNIRILAVALIVCLPLAVSAGSSKIPANKAAAVEAGEYIIQNGEKVPLVLADDLAAITFTSDLSGSSALELGEALAKEMGHEVVQTKVGTNQVIVKADRKDLAKSLEARKGLGGKVSKVRPVFYLDGISPQSMVTIPGRVVVSFKPEVGIDGREQVLERYGLEIAKRLPYNTYSLSTSIPEEQIPALAVRILEENPGLVAFTEPAMDQFCELYWSTALPRGDEEVDLLAGTGADPLGPEQWHIQNTGRNTTGPAYGYPDEDTDAPRHWNPYIRRFFAGDGRDFGYFGEDPFGNRVVVAVFDSGTDLGHEDWDINQADAFNGNVGRSVLDGRIGFDYSESDPDPNARLDAHGTAVAGIIAAARNNGRGGTGIAPSAKIYTQRIFNDIGQATTSDNIASAVQDAALAQVDIGNHSWGGPGYSQILELAFRFAYEAGRFNLGMPNFVSSGNNYTYVSYPALFDWTFSVGGVDDRGNRVSYASYGGKLDFVAPTQQFGRDGIVTTDISGNAGYDGSDPLDLLDPRGNYTRDFNGTSAACPVMVGMATLILAEYPDIPIQPYQEFEINGVVGDLFELLALTADRPPDPAKYMPGFNTMTTVRWVTFDDEGSTQLVISQFGNPLGFRRNRGYNVDGFVYEFGYGRPNPYNLINQHFAKSPYRDYIPVSSNPEEPLAGIDLGELRVLYASDFTADYVALEEDCLTPEPEGEEDKPEPIPREEADPAELVDCIRSQDGSDPEPLVDWSFSVSRSDVTSDGSVLSCEIGDEESGPVEFHYWSTNEGRYYSGFPTSHDFEFGESEAIAGRIDGNVFPYVINTSIPWRSPEMTIDGAPTGDDEPDARWYNPRGRYLSDATYTIRGEVQLEGLEPPVDPEPPYDQVFAILELTMKHDLTIWDATTPNSIGQEFDNINVSVQYETQSGFRTVQAGQILGSSHNETVPPFFPASSINDEDPDCEREGPDVERAAWSLAGYIPSSESSSLSWRTYRFPVTLSSIAEPYNVNVIIEMNTGSSYLPEWDFTEDEISQLWDTIERDGRGMQLAQVRILGLDVENDEETQLNAEDIAAPEEILVSRQGTNPIFTTGENEIVYLKQDENGINSKLEVAYTDGFTRLPDFGNQTGTPLLVPRQPNPLLQACKNPTDPAGDCEPAEILSLDISGQRTEMIYVADSAPGEPRVFTVSDDAFDEQPLYSKDDYPDGDLPDTFVQEAIFASLSNTIILNEGNRIYSVLNDGTSPEFIIDSAGTKLRNMQSITLDNSESVIGFTATDDEGDQGIYWTLRNTNRPGLALFFDEIIDWPYSNEREGRFSPDGERLIFSSNTLGDSAPGPPPPDDAPYRIYIIDNIQEVLFYSNSPSYDGPDVHQVELWRDIRLNKGSQATFYDSGIQPRFLPSSSSGSGKIAFVGLLDRFLPEGEIAIVDLPPRVPFEAETPTPYPTPSPTPTPYPTATPGPDEQVTQVGQYVFDQTGDGWQFFSAEPIYREPDHSTLFGDLRMFAQEDNMNTFGYFQSPANALKLYPFDIMDDSTQAEPGLPLAEREGPHYMVRFYLRRTTELPGEAPMFRIRVNSFENEDAHIMVVSSLGDLYRVPGFSKATATDLLFQPHPYMYNVLDSRRSYFVAFDLINALPDDDPNGGFILERVDLFRIPLTSVHTVDNVVDFDFNTQEELDVWKSYTVPSLYTEPVFSASLDEGRLEMAAPNPDSVFGYWQNTSGTIVADRGGRLEQLFVRAEARVGADETDPMKVPEMRFRLSDDSFQGSASQGVFGISSGTFIPSQGEDRVFRTYLVFPDTTLGELPLHYSWDLLSFEQFATDIERAANATSPNKVFLESLDIDLITIDDYPEADDFE